MAVVPYIPPEKRLPELTVKALILGVLLSIILGAANTYLGLRVGLTVSASIPAAVVSMALLRMFRRHNVLENNAVQTAASAGESLAAGVLFTIPALLLLGHWQSIQYFETTVVALLGGILGVLFTVPLRRALIVEAELLFPEGIATAEVLKAGEKNEDAPGATEAMAAKGMASGSLDRRAARRAARAAKRAAKAADPARAGLIALLIGAISGAVYKFMQTGTKMWTETALFGRKFADNGVVAIGGDLSPALLGVGYIIGLHIAALVFLGGVMGWVIAIPLYSLVGDHMVQTTTGKVDFTTVGDAGATANFLWSNLIRYIGVGAMLVGGVWSLIKLRKPLGSAMKQGFTAAKKSPEAQAAVLRTEREFGMGPTMLGVVGIVIPLFFVYWYATEALLPALVLSVIMVITGFLFSAVAAYMAGLVGSSNNPISGVTILTVLFAAFALKFMGVESDIGPAATILVAATIACAGAIGGDNMQDLKAGYLLGSTPKRQQTMQVIGVVAAALTVALVLRILTDAYELGSPELAAPQAGLMASVADFVFNGGLPTTMIGIGIGIAVLLIILDTILEKKGAKFRTPVMPVAVGIYLPIGLTTPIFLGGLIAWATGRKTRDGHHEGILFSSGLIAGEALIGIGIAALVAAEVDDALSLGAEGLQWAGLVMFSFVTLLLIYIVMRKRIVARLQR